jgi:hypothetical protein
MIPLGHSEAWGTLIYEKNLKSKISCQTPFKFEILSHKRNFKSHLTLSVYKHRDIS